VCRKHVKTTAQEPIKCSKIIKTRRIKNSRHRRTTEETRDKMYENSLKTKLSKKRQAAMTVMETSENGGNFEIQLEKRKRQPLKSTKNIDSAAEVAMHTQVRIDLIAQNQNKTLKC
jgi:hypothetical protein